MKRTPPELLPINPQVKRRTLLGLCIGLLGGSVMVFTVVWSGTKAHLEKKKAEASSTLTPSQGQETSTPLQEPKKEAP
ncbi:hypothetical protein [Pseudobacteriovorax antillogorgiicola]|uniref:Uncharacterized protein n=1 Tax=Pseudobacteriovorax antillogorgiicola TaxID=1513793 RepID=A0A1Y6CTQ1_9BACT|nr:hypothetical protein [Pseudobacteriovorax antillogorgiicola]TCS44445.1 hypothetical protein EDD56_13372 [Pseudobacteriovorax antillogorgiicola]SMF78780.1 hypothetical protein SAMN06296036_1332 [Pseudobacteriovorax antillogorgiicola]